MGTASVDVMVVDDEEELRELLVELLVDQGFAAVGVPGAEQALHYLREHEPPRLIIVDVKLEGMSGLDFIAHKEMLPRAAEVPVLICTASKRFGTEPPAGAAAVFHKPIDIDAMSAAVARLVRGVV
jgi:DNA-binding NtrC family response regulator